MITQSSLGLSSLRLSSLKPFSARLFQLRLFTVKLFTVKLSPQKLTCIALQVVGSIMLEQASGLRVEYPVTKTTLNPNDSPRLLRRELIHPRYWPIWLGFGLAALVTLLPHRLQMKIGTGIGALGYHVAKRRRHIVEVNIALCFPELSQQQRQQLVRQTLRSVGISLIETARVWIWNPRLIRRRVTIHGIEHLHAAVARGHGVLLLGMHLSTLDFCGAALGCDIDMDVMYRANANPLLETLMTRGRMKAFPARSSAMTFAAFCAASNKAMSSGMALIKITVVSRQSLYPFSAFQLRPSQGRRAWLNSAALPLWSLVIIAVRGTTTMISIYQHHWRISPPVIRSLIRPKSTRWLRLLCDFTLSSIGGYIDASRRDRRVCQTSISGSIRQSRVRLFNQLHIKQRCNKSVNPIKTSASIHLVDQLAPDFFRRQGLETGRID